MSAQPPICVKCRKPVSRTENVELFEGMRWLCFHFEYEHGADPDGPCADPSCPWWHIRVLRLGLERLGEDPEKVIEQAIKERWQR
jgi:hypothetical protein